MAPRKPRAPKTTTIATPSRDPFFTTPPPSLPQMIGQPGQALEMPGNQQGKRVTSPIKLGQETGVPGIKHWFGRLYEEFLPKLEGEQGRKQFSEMAWNDPTIRAFLYAIRMLMRGLTWTVEPPPDLAKDQEATDRAQIVESCLHDLDVPWASVVDDAFTSLIYGFAVQELVFKLRKGKSGEIPSNHDDGLIGFAKFAPRHQETIWRWELDRSGSVLGVIQWAPPAFQFTRIDREQMIHYKTEEWHGSPEGVSVLRGCYVPYNFKKTIQNIEAVGIERDCVGIPVVRMPAERMRLAGESFDSDDHRAAKAELDAMTRLARDIKTDQQQGLVFPIEYDQEGHELYQISLMSASGTRAIDCGQAIQRYKQEIAGCLLADFLLFGHETTGTQALGGSRKELFVLAVSALVDGFCGAINRTAIPALYEYNGWDGPTCMLGHSELTDVDLGTLGPFLTVLANAGIDLTDDATQRDLRRKAGIPVPEIEGSR